MQIILIVYFLINLTLNLSYCYLNPKPTLPSSNCIVCGSTFHLPRSTHQQEDRWTYVWNATTTSTQLYFYFHNSPIYRKTAERRPFKQKWKSEFLIIGFFSNFFCIRRVKFYWKNISMCQEISTSLRKMQKHIKEESIDIIAWRNKCIISEGLCITYQRW